MSWDIDRGEFDEAVERGDWEWLWSAYEALRQELGPSPARPDVPLSLGDRLLTVVQHPHFRELKRLRTRWTVELDADSQAGSKDGLLMNTDYVAVGGVGGEGEDAFRVFLMGGATLEEAVGVAFAKLKGKP
jgi:hypothetical protein